MDQTGFWEIAVNLGSSDCNELAKVCLFWGSAEDALAQAMIDAAAIYGRENVKRAYNGRQIVFLSDSNPGSLAAALITSVQSVRPITKFYPHIVSYYYINDIPWLQWRKDHIYDLP